MAMIYLTSASNGVDAKSVSTEKRMGVEDIWPKVVLTVPQPVDTACVGFELIFMGNFTSESS